MAGPSDWQAEISVVTPESVSFSYEVAGIGSRFLALLVDHVIESLAFLALLLAAGGLGWMRNRYFALLAVSSGTLLYVGYFVAFEILWDGQTPGKRLTHLRVIRDGGYGLTALECLLRNLLRVIDFLPVFYGFGLVSMFVSEKSRRLGDFVAGTLVVKDQLSTIPARTRLAQRNALNGLFPEGQTLIRERLSQFTPEELHVMREFIRRRAELALAARQNLVAKLGTAIVARIPELRGMDGAPGGERLIEAVVAAQEERILGEPQ